MRERNVRLRSDVRTVETLEIDLSEYAIDPTSEVELIITTPDNRSHKVRVNRSWFVPTRDVQGEIASREEGNVYY